MISIRVDTRALRKARETLVENVNRKYRAHVYKMFEDMLLVDAQFSGDHVSNWRITVDPGGAGYQEWADKGSVLTSQQPHKAGDPEAVTFARDRARRVPFDYKQKLYFTNASPLKFTGTTVTGPDGSTHRLRPENIIGSGILVASYLRAKYGNIT